MKETFMEQGMKNKLFNTKKKFVLKKDLLRS